MRDGRVLGPLVAALVLAAFTILVALPWASEKRDYPASIPQASPLFFTTVVELKPGAEACFRDAVFEEHSEEARFRVGTRRREGAPLRMRVRGGAYAQEVRIPGGYADNVLLEVPIRPPPVATPVRVCIRNEGRTQMDIYGATDRTRSRSRVYVDGRLSPDNLVFGLWEREPRSIAERWPETVERMTVFRAGVVGEGLLWILLALTVVGVPAAVLVALRRALGEPDPDEAPGA